MEGNDLINSLLSLSSTYLISILNILNNPSLINHKLQERIMMKLL